MNVAAAGDINAEKFNEQIVNNFADWKKQTINKFDKKLTQKNILTKSSQQ